MSDDLDPHQPGESCPAQEAIEYLALAHLDALMTLIQAELLPDQRASIDLGQIGGYCLRFGLELAVCAPEWAAAVVADLSRHHDASTWADHVTVIREAAATCPMREVSDVEP